MERDNYNPYHFESSDEKSDDKKESGKKKAKSASGLGKLLARQEETKEADKPLNKDERSFLQKIAGESVKVEADPDAERSEDSDETVPLEELSAAEQAETAQAYIKERAQELSAEAESSEDPQETDADATFLAALHDRLASVEEPGDVDEAIEGAFDDAVAEMVTNEAAHEAPTEHAEPQDLEQDEAVTLAGAGGRPPLPPQRRLGGAAFGPEPRSGAFPRATELRPRSSNGETEYSSVDVQRIERSAAGRGLLVGGILGYLMGRRRGRIKTEKRLQGVQDKLEKQVVAVQQKIEEKESAIRQLVRERTGANASVARTNAERTPAFTPRAPEVAQTASVSERLTMRPNQEAESTPTKPTSETAKMTVDTLNKEELLAFSAQIRVGETSLRRVYEAKLVDEKGLRRLIKEYQAGHDLRRALAREFMVKELRFERDPTLRDLLPPEAQPRRQSSESTKGAEYGAGGAAASVESNTATANQYSMSSRTPVARSASALKRSFKPRQQNVSPALLIGLTLLTIGLAIYAIWLTITK